MHNQENDQFINALASAGAANALGQKISPAQQRNKQICDLVFSLIIHVVLGYLFYTFSTDESKYEGEGCVSLRQYSNIYGIVLLVSAALILIMLLSVFLIKAEHISDGQAGCAACAACVLLLLCIFSLVMFIILFFVYFKNEPCGDLRILVFWYFVISIGLTLLSCCCSCVLGAASSNTQQSNF